MERLRFSRDYFVRERSLYKRRLSINLSWQMMKFLHGLFPVVMKFYLDRYQPEGLECYLIF